MTEPQIKAPAIPEGNDGKPLDLTGVLIVAVILAQNLRDQARSLDEAANVIEEAVNAERSGKEWQPIATAPKDETQVLLYGVCRKPSVDAGRTAIVIGYWTDFNTGGWVWYGAAMEFTHWQPLPAAPKGGA